MTLSDDQLWRQLRGSDAGTILLATEDAGGALTTEQATAAVDDGNEWDAGLALARLCRPGA